MSGSSGTTLLVNSHIRVVEPGAKANHRDQSLAVPGDRTDRLIVDPSERFAALYQGGVRDLHSGPGSRGF